MTQLTSASEMVEVLRGVTKETEVHMIVDVPAEMRKTNNPLAGHVTKRTALSGLICGDTLARMNEILVQRGQAPRTELGKRPWGTRLGDTSLITHNDEYYIDVWVMTSAPSFRVDNREATDGELTAINKFLSREKEGKPFFPCRTYKLANVVKLELTEPEPELEAGICISADFGDAFTRLKLAPLGKRPRGPYVGLLENMADGRLYDLMDVLALGAKALREEKRDG